ncbi:hypothetical protein CIK86_08360 [Pseudoalteromonas sp. JB197]|nr:hypothetical protein CIK86_08360 [Pseudoalteromonas sp. JB197]
MSAIGTFAKFGCEREPVIEVGLIQQLIDLLTVLFAHIFKQTSVTRILFHLTLLKVIENSAIVIP